MPRPDAPLTPFAVAARDRWLAAAALVAAVAYGWLAVLHPTGESWGRGWNMVAFWIYAAPVVLAAGVVAGVRTRRLPEGRARRWGWTVAAAAAAFPLVALLVMRLRA